MDSQYSTREEDNVTKARVACLEAQMALQNATFEAQMALQNAKFEELDASFSKFKEQISKKTFSIDGKIANNEFITMANDMGFESQLNTRSDGHSWYTFWCPHPHGRKDIMFYLENHSRTDNSDFGMITTPNKSVRKKCGCDYSMTDSGSNGWKQFGASSVRTCYDIKGKPIEDVMKIMIQLRDSIVLSDS